jgi:hypothetical protein
MNPEQRQQYQQTANRMTVFCLISLVIGIYIIWANSAQGTVDSSTRLFLLCIVAGVHLLGGTIALYHARKTEQVARNLHVYGYFAITLVLLVKLVYISL